MRTIYGLRGLGGSGRISGLGFGTYILEFRSSGFRGLGFRVEGLGVTV